MSAMALDGVVAMVSCRSHGYMDPAPVIHSKLRAMGAKVAQRFGKDITHIIFNRKLNPTPQERGLEDADLRMLHDKAAKMDYPVAIVTPLWVSQSQELGRRALEGHFMLARPAQPTATEQAIGSAATPGSTKGKKTTGRRALIKCDDIELGFDLDSPMFSSSQQMKGGAEDSAAENSKQTVGSRGGQRAGNPGKASPVMKPLRERLLLGGGQAVGLGAKGSANATGRSHGANQQQWGQASWRAPRVASQMTDIRAFKTPMPKLPAPTGPAEVIDLATTMSESKPMFTPAGKRQRVPDGMHTPAPSPCTSDSPGSVVPCSVPSSAKNGRPSLRLPLPSPVPAPLPCTASISTPKLNATAASIVTPKLARPLASRTTPGTGSKSAHTRVSAKSSAVTQPMVTPDPEEPMENDGSDYMELDIGASTQQVADTLLNFGRSVSNPLYQLEGPQVYGNALFAQEKPRASVQKDASGSAAQDVSHQGMRRSVDLPGGQGSRKAAPPLWGAKRVRSGGSPATSAAAKAKPTPQSNEKRQKVSGQSRGPAASSATVAGSQAASSIVGYAPAGGSAAVSGLVAPKLIGRPSGHAASSACSPMKSPSGAGHKGGLVASTSVSAAEAELLKAAVRKLRSGYRLCPDGRQPTHLVVGAERRTLKILQAIARGARLMSPEWVEKSLHAGRWLPEEEYHAKVRFSVGAKRARECLSNLRMKQLLEDYRIFVCDRSGEGSKIRSNAEVIRNLATTLGAQVVPARGCTLCITTGGTGRPTNISASVPVVEEEWLFHSIEQYEELDMKKWLVTSK